MKTNFYKKLIFSCMLMLAAFGSMAATKKTVASGDWFEPSNWSPAGVPFMEDTVIVSHEMTSADNIEFMASLFILENSGIVICDSMFAVLGNVISYGVLNTFSYLDEGGDSTIIYGDVVTPLMVISNLYSANYGEILADTLVMAESGHNYGYMEAAIFVAGATEFVNHSGAALYSTDMGIFSTITTNETGAHMELNFFMADISFTNDGTIEADMWMQMGGTVDGAGRFCIANCFQNSGDIGGTVDICDATPNDGSCDLNSGTIAGTVTFCEAIPCWTSVGIEERDAAVQVYPNPAHDFLRIQNAGSDVIWSVSDVNGKIWLTGNNLEGELVIDISALSTGVYILSLANGAEVTSHRFLRD